MIVRRKNMKWSGETVLDRNIEQVWSLFLPGKRHILFPDQENAKLVSGDEQMGKAVYRIPVEDGRRSLKLESEILTDEADKKMLKQTESGGGGTAVSTYGLEKSDENRTNFVFAVGEENSNKVVQGMLESLEKVISS